MLASGEGVRAEIVLMSQPESTLREKFVGWVLAPTRSVHRAMSAPVIDYRIVCPGTSDRRVAWVRAPTLPPSPQPVVPKPPQPPNSEKLSGKSTRGFKMALTRESKYVY